MFVNIFLNNIGWMYNFDGKPLFGADVLAWDNLMLTLVGLPERATAQQLEHPIFVAKYDFVFHLNY